ncbi:MAG: hypothetical protein KJ601_01800 [Nanoarchaeota archaeon]|nr:hypothetical protein [Nanoarchaeota archaeon]MBU1704733.1 hypothetical protein [Nanoarchaeota archaeon]
MEKQSSRLKGAYDYTCNFLRTNYDQTALALSGIAAGIKISSADDIVNPATFTAVVLGTIGVLAPFVERTYVFERFNKRGYNDDYIHSRIHVRSAIDSYPTTRVARDVATGLSAYFVMRSIYDPSAFNLSVAAALAGAAFGASLLANNSKNKLDDIVEQHKL